MEYENPNRLLVVEDNAEVRALAIRIGTLSGYQCAGCASLSEFHREFSSLSPTVILLDLVLGDEDALPVIDFLASVQYRNPVLLMSKSSDSCITTRQALHAKDMDTPHLKEIFVCRIMILNCSQLEV